jgi:hypothetical protein
MVDYSSCFKSAMISIRWQKWPIIKKKLIISHFLMSWKFFIKGSRMKNKDIAVFRGKIGLSFYLKICLNFSYILFWIRISKLPGFGSWLSESGSATQEHLPLINNHILNFRWVIRGRIIQNFSAPLHSAGMLQQYIVEDKAVAEG